MLTAILLCNTAPAAAQGVSPPTASEVDGSARSDIVVTATRRPLREQDVAAATNILPAAVLEAQSIRSFDDLSRSDPGLQLVAYQGETQLFVRGIGAVTFIGGFDSSIAVNLDGVYLGRPTAVASALFDIERVEILKGPQGTLYGRNATGGAINLVRREPTAAWRTDARIAIGNYGRADANAGIGGPLADNLNVRVALGTNNHRGFTRLYLGRDANGDRIAARAESRHDLAARARLDWTVTPAVRIELSGDYYRADDRAVLFHFAGPGYANNPLFLSNIAEGDVGGYGTREINASVLPFNKPENWGVSARVVANLGGPILTATTSARRTHARNLTDMSNSTVLGESQFKDERAAQFSQDVELRSAEGSHISYVVGASFFRERNAIRNEFFIPRLVGYLGGPGTADCCLLRANGSVDTDAYALFGEAGLPLGPATTATIGARVGRERRSGTNLLDFTGFATLNEAILAPATFHSFTPKIALEHRLGSLGIAYASATKGYKAGGFNVGSPQNDPYEPETIWSYEIGAKLRPAQNWQLDLSAFHYDYDDLQVQDVDQNSVLIRNAATAKVDGIELGTRWNHANRLEVGLMAAWLNARFSRYATVNTKTPQLGVLDLRGNPLPQAPQWRVLGHIEYEAPLGTLGSMRLRADASWQDRIYFSAFKDAKATQPGYVWLKARATLLPARSPYRIALFVDNLTDRKAFTNISITGDLDASRALGTLAPPRTWGLELSLDL